MAKADLDLICLGRAAVDLYGEQIGSPLEDTASFAKSLGGCAANIAVGAARQGLRVGMLSRVGDEHMGRFVKAALHAEGVDTSRVRTDPERLTGLVLLSVRDAHTFPLVFYRERCADMALSAEDVDPGWVGRARALLLTGTHLSEPGVRAASEAALTAAKAAGRRAVLDVDYRPVLWGLTGHGRGEDRYVASARVTEVLQGVLPRCDLVVGTEEEIRIAGGDEELEAALTRIRALTDATVVVKRGPMGCTVIDGDARIEAPGRPVEVLNVLGAGDAFLAGFLRGWVAEEPLARSAEYANACGALVVSRHQCAPAMPTRREIDDLLARPAPPARIDRDLRIARLHRVGTRAPGVEELCVLAFDHRVQLERLADAVGAPRARLSELKLAIADGAARAAARAGLARPGVIVDDTHGRAVLDRLTEPGSRWWIARPVERPTDVELGFAGDPNVELEIAAWPSAHVVKCLVHRIVDDHALGAWQDARLVRLQEACRRLRRTLLVEVLPRPREGQPVDPELLPEIVDHLYDIGVAPDWWKLPPPPHDDVWRQLDRVVERRDPDCQGVLVLGLDAPRRTLAAELERAGGHRVCRGFAVGRTIFFAPARAWLAGELPREGLVESVAEGFEAMVRAYRAGRSGS